VVLELLLELLLEDCFLSLLLKKPENKLRFLDLCFGGCDIWVFDGLGLLGADDKAVISAGSFKRLKS